jgi:hypothetical protein
MTNDWVWDVETYINVFTAAFEHADTPTRVAFEISDWRNDSVELVSFINWLASTNARLVGFNNLGFDYPILHQLLKMGKSDARTLYDKAQAIIDSQDGGERWGHMVYASDRVVPQIDLMRIRHYEYGSAKATGLKALEFAMRADNIEDLPFPVGSVLTREQVPVLKRYNAHDVSQTKRFYFHTLEMIKFREELCRKYPGKDWLNFNDGKIGKEYFTMELEKAGVQCFEFGPNGRTPRQTRRSSIALKDCILPWIKFDSPDLTRVLEWFKGQTITETKGVFKDITATVNGFTFVFGLGGIHGSVENRVFEADDEWAIVDLDVTSMYPNVAIKNKLYPEHLGEKFCDIYEDLFEQRKKYPKKSAESAMLKLALNSVFGDSNSPFSVFFDSRFTMSITLSGQMLLALLAEQIMKWTDAELVQCNTDGVTVRIRRSEIPDLEKVRVEWQALTKLNLEEARYKRFFVGDVNSYLGEYEDGSVKRKGRYQWDVEFHQDSSALVVPKVAEKVLLTGAGIRETLSQWTDIHDFMIRVKVPRTGHLQWGDNKVQNTTRYLVTEDGKPLRKWLPPLKDKSDWRGFAVQAGWLVQVCNDIKDAEGARVNLDYYATEIEKLVLRLA